MCFLDAGRILFHPATYLISWAVFALGLQFLDWQALAVVALATLAIGGRAMQRWGRLVWRAKWLLLTLWIVLAYGTPGYLWQGFSWAPSVEGMELAALHVLRLILLLASLAYLFERVPHRDFMVGLWVLARPFAFLGLDADRSVARLALVFDYLEHAPPKGSWRHFLEPQAEGGRILESLRLEIPRWRMADAILLLALTAVLTLLLILP
ncbi:MAG: hypothetical protein BWY57_01891 [Betaproteobacteria bacterium ADurb.Bin341]|nr:MAG: hypothetical protein BWY57_01891 [Betaproteobacteria bacterium ADurb.Bin341]